MQWKTNRKWLIEKACGFSWKRAKIVMLKFTHMSIIGILLTMVYKYLSWYKTLKMSMPKYRKTLLYNLNLRLIEIKAFEIIFWWTLCIILRKVIHFVKTNTTLLKFTDFYRKWIFDWNSVICRVTVSRNVIHWVMVKRSFITWRWFASTMKIKKLKKCWKR